MCARTPIPSKEVPHYRALWHVLNRVFASLAKQTRCILGIALNTTHAPGGGPSIEDGLEEDGFTSWRNLATFTEQLHSPQDPFSGVARWNAISLKVPSIGASAQQMCD